MIPMRIFFLTSAHNSLSQRLETQLTERGHEIRARKCDSQRRHSLRRMRSAVRRQSA